MKRCINFVTIIDTVTYPLERRTWNLSIFLPLRVLLLWVQRLAHTNSTVSGVYLAAGNIAAIVLIASLVYGGQNLMWWIPVSFLIVSFPAVYHILLRRILKPKVGSVVYAGLALVGLIPMIQGWMA